MSIKMSVQVKETRENLLNIAYKTLLVMCDNKTDKHYLSTVLGCGSVEAKFKDQHGTLNLKYLVFFSIENISSEVCLLTVTAESANVLELMNYHTNDDALKLISDFFWYLDIMLTKGDSGIAELCNIKSRLCNELENYEKYEVSCVIESDTYPAILYYKENELYFHFKNSKYADLSILYGSIASVDMTDDLYPKIIIKYFAETMREFSVSLNTLSVKKYKAICIEIVNKILYKTGQSA